MLTICFDDDGITLQRVCRNSLAPFPWKSAKAFRRSNDSDSLTWMPGHVPMKSIVTRCTLCGTLLTNGVDAIYFVHDSVQF